MRTPVRRRIPAAPLSRPCASGRNEPGEKAWRVLMALKPGLPAQLRPASPGGKAAALGRSDTAYARFAPHTCGARSLCSAHAHARSLPQTRGTKESEFTPCACGIKRARDTRRQKNRAADIRGKEGIRPRQPPQPVMRARAGPGRAGPGRLGQRESAFCGGAAQPPQRARETRNRGSGGDGGGTAMRRRQRQLG